MTTSHRAVHIITQPTLPGIRASAPTAQIAHAAIRDGGLTPAVFHVVRNSLADLDATPIGT